MQPIINGSIDSARAVGESSELWHIPRHGNGLPLCYARLGGRIRTTKGRPRCHACRESDLPGYHGLDDDAKALLLAVHTNKSWMVGGRNASGVQTLEEHDYVWFKTGGACVITPRGLVVAQEILAPSPWLDPKTRLLHERRPLADNTRCGVVVGTYSTYDLGVLARLAKSKGRKTPNCIACLGAKW